MIFKEMDVFFGKKEEDIHPLEQAARKCLDIARSMPNARAALIAEDHVIEDLGFIPTVVDYFKEMPLADWMAGGRRHEVGNRPRMKINLTAEQYEDLLKNHRVD